MRPQVWVFSALLSWPAVAAGQAPADVAAHPEAPGANEEATAAVPPSAEAYVPVSLTGRMDWIVTGTVGRRSLGVGVMAATWQTAWNSPEEWQRTWAGFGKRYLEREADVAISSALEAGLGALWGEEPRYIPSGRRGIWPRARYATRTVFLAQRRDGHLAPAWGRYAGNVVNNVIENAWLPPSATTLRSTAIRSGEGFLGRLAGNLWDEFWPDARRRWFRW